MTTQGNGIGLALSGGGHRATVFALGALLYLVDSGRNKDVTTITSVSGGSLTNAFLARLPKAFNELTPEEFDGEAARFARQIAGDRKWWKISWLTYLILFVLWGAYTLKDFPASVWSLPQVFVAPVVVAWAIFIGPRSGGTLWAWWGSWLYTGLMVPTVSITLALTLTIAVWWSWSVFALYLCLLLMVVVALYFRTKVTELAFDATIYARGPRQFSKRATATDVDKLANLPSKVRHVFCATEAHSGQHAYFTHDLIYAPYFGLAEPRDFRLCTAVQVSANFPGGFPFRLLSASPFNAFTMNSPDFLRGVRIPPFLALTDGGVYDNTGASWYLEADDRPDSLHKWSQLDRVANVPDPMKQRILTQLEAMRPRIGRLIIINSSMPTDWSAINLVPGVAELAHLLRVTGILYNNKGIAQNRKLAVDFLSERGERVGQGCVVSIDSNPEALAALLAHPEKRHPIMVFDNQVRLRAEQVDRLLSQATILADHKRASNHKKDSIQTALQDAKAQLAHLSEGSVAYIQQERIVIDLEFALMECETQSRERELQFRWNKIKEWQAKSKILSASPYVATTFRPLGQDVTAGLLYHGYLGAMVSTSIMSDDFPIMEPVPGREVFHSLALGKSRTEFPQPKFL